MSEDSATIYQDETFFDPNDVDSTPELGPVTAGQYKLRLQSLRMRAQKPEKGGRQYLTATFDIPDEPTAESVDHFITFVVRRSDVGTTVNTEKGPKTITQKDFEDSQRAYRDFLRALGAYVPGALPKFSGTESNLSCPELRGHECVAFLSVKPDARTPNKMVNNISSFSLPGSDD